jgi:RNA polymerase sigma-70 factor (ECF subfamily)
MQPAEIELYEATVSRWWLPIRAYATRLLLGDVKEAEDVAQEAVLRLWENWSNIDATRAKSWLLRTTYRLIVDRIRLASYRSRRAGTPGDDMFFLQDPTDRMGQVEDRLEADAMLAYLSRARAETIRLYADGWEMHEIAAVMGVPIGTIKSRLSEARARAREIRADLDAGRKPTLQGQHRPRSQKEAEAEHGAA